MFDEKYFNEFIDKEIGVINNPMFLMPNRHFMPPSLVQMSVLADNLSYVGCAQNKIIASGIGFNRKTALYSTIGEFIERYIASIPLPKENYLKDTHANIRTQYEIADLEKFNFFANSQYDIDGFEYKKITEDSLITWIKGRSYITDKEIFYPSCFVHLFSFDKGFILPSTSTGLAAGSTDKQAFQSGLLECLERHAFVNCWYLQGNTLPIKYSKETIIKSFPDDEEISILFNNNNLEIVVMDLTQFTHVPTFLSIAYFTYKGKKYYSCGCSSRLNVRDAIIKSMLECYQGLDYAIILENECKEKMVPINDFKKDEELVDFKYHFWFYNAYPEVREKIPLFIHSKSENGFSDSLFEHKHVLKNFDNPIDLFNSIGDVLVFDLQNSYLEKDKFRVLKVVVPQLKLLSGHAKYPFLGYDDFEENNSSLFLEYPHFFP